MNTHEKALTLAIIFATVTIFGFFFSWEHTIPAFLIMGVSIIGFTLSLVRAYKTLPH